MFKDKGPVDLDMDFYKDRGIKIDLSEVPLLQDAVRTLDILKTKSTWELQMCEFEAQLRKTQIHLEDLRDEVIPQKDIKINDLLHKIESLNDSYKHIENKLNEQIQISSEKGIKINALESEFNILLNIGKHDVGIMTDLEPLDPKPMK